MDPKTGVVKWVVAATTIDQHGLDFMGDGCIGVDANNVDFTPDGSMLGARELSQVGPTLELPNN